MGGSVLEYCIEIVREIAISIAHKIPDDKIFVVEAHKKLKTSDEFGWKRLCSLMDLIGDTELAKDNFLRFDLTGPTKNNEIGECYLRLYGILNSIYLQTWALIELMELSKLGKKKIYKEELESLKLMQLRHIAGAHTLNYDIKGKRIPYQINQPELGLNRVKVLGPTGDFVEYNLKKLILQFNRKFDSILFETVEKFVSTVYKKDQYTTQQYRNWLNAIKRATNREINVSYEFRGTTNYLELILNHPDYYSNEEE